MKNKSLRRTRNTVFCMLVLLVSACNTQERNLLKYDGNKVINWIAMNSDSVFFRSDTVLMYEQRHLNEEGYYDDNPEKLPIFKNEKYITIYFRNKETFTYGFSDSMNGTA